MSVSSSTIIADSTSILVSSVDLSASTIGSSVVGSVSVSKISITLSLTCVSVLAFLIPNAIGTIKKELTQAIAHINAIVLLVFFLEIFLIKSPLS